MSKYFKLLFAFIVLPIIICKIHVYGSVDSDNRLSIFSQEERDWISAHPEISVVIDPDFPPYEFYDEHGVASGVNVDIVHLIERKTGLRFKFVRTPSWVVSLDRVINRKVDMVTALVPTEHRRQYMLFSTPIVELPVVIVSQAGKKEHMTLNDLKGKTVAIVNGYVMANYIAEHFPEIKVHPVPNARVGMRMVSSGEAFAMLEYLSSVSYWIGKEGISNLKIVGETFQFARLSMGVRKDWPMLQQILNKSLKLVTKSDRKDIIGKWVSLHAPPFYANKKFWLMSGAVTGGVILLFFLMLCWNWSLRAVVRQRTQSLKKELDERLKAEEALRAREEQFKTIFENAEDAIFIMDRSTFTDFNNITMKLFGATREELLGHSPVDFSPEFQADGRRSTEKAKEFIEAAYRGEPQFFDWIHQRPDGTHFYSEIKLSRIQLQGRDLLQAIVRDVTARKQAQQEKEKLQDQLLQAQKLESVGRLAGGVAHDFNNMLCVIIGYTERIMRSIDSTWSLYSELEEIRNAASRSAALTRQLLAFARKENVEPEVLDINDVVSGMLKMIRRLLGENIELSWFPYASPGTIYMDPAQVDQVLVNLCVNARDAIANTGNIIIETDNVIVDKNYCIEHTDFTAGEYVVLKVSDNGCGMDAETKAHVFEPFFTTKETGKGTGMGLATIHGIVKQNNGFINVYSEPGKGTTFKIYIPRYRLEHDDVNIQEPIQSDVGGNETILLVEDEEILLELSSEILENLGYRILAVNSPNKAIQLAEKFNEHIDLLVTDVIMPEMNGRELAQQLTKTIPGLKVIYMSGYTANVIADRGIIDQDINFIQKPYNSNDLSRKIRAALDNRDDSGGSA